MIHDKYTYFLLAILLVINLACKDNKTAEAIKATETRTSVVDENVTEKENAETSIVSWNENVKRLEKLTPTSKDKLESWLPSTIVGLVRKADYTINSYEDFATINADFEKNDKYLKLNIIDGAGQRGSQLVAPAQNIATQNLDQKTLTGYVKTVKENNIIARERYQESIKQYSFRFFYKNRFFTTITSNLSREKLLKAIDDLELNELIYN